MLLKLSILAILKPKFIMIPNKVKLKSVLFRKAETFIKTPNLQDG